MSVWGVTDDFASEMGSGFTSYKFFLRHEGKDTGSNGKK